MIELTSTAIARKRPRYAHCNHIICLTCGIISSTTLHAETLVDALRETIAKSPVLQAERERLKATDQSVSAARAGFLPTISAGAQVGWQENRFAVTPDLAMRQKPYGFSVTLDQPLFDGGAALAAVRRATASVRAGQAMVASVESDVLVAAAVAFADVVQTRAVQTLQTGSMATLATLRSMTRERRGVGDATIADLAQTEAALANAQLQVSAAQTNLVNAESQFLQVVRHAPGPLDAFSPARLPLPDQLELALQIADAQHPAIRAARDRETAARHAIDAANAKYLPTVSLQASYNTRRDLDGLPSPGDVRAGATVQAVARIPLYSGGSIDAEVTAARHTRLSLVHELTQQRAVVRNQVTQAWAAWTQSAKTRKSLSQQIEANSRALASLQREQASGQRPLSDVLVAQRDLLASRIALEQTKRQATVAAFAVLANVGVLTLEAVSAPAPSKPLAAVVAARPAGPGWSTTVHVVASKTFTAVRTP